MVRIIRVRKKNRKRNTGEVFDKKAINIVLRRASTLKSVSSLCRGHANLLCIVPIFSYVTRRDNKQGLLLTVLCIGYGFGSLAGRTAPSGSRHGFERTSPPNIMNRPCPFRPVKRTMHPKTLLFLRSENEEPDYEIYSWMLLAVLRLSFALKVKCWAAIHFCSLVCWTFGGQRADGDALVTDNECARK